MPFDRDAHAKAIAELLMAEVGDEEEERDVLERLGLVPPRRASIIVRHVELPGLFARLWRALNARVF